MDADFLTDLDLGLEPFSDIIPSPAPQSEDITAFINEEDIDSMLTEWTSKIEALHWLPTSDFTNDFDLLDYIGSDSKTLISPFSRDSESNDAKLALSSSPNDDGNDRGDGPEMTSSILQEHNYSSPQSKVSDCHPTSIKPKSVTAALHVETRSDIPTQTPIATSTSTDVEEVAAKNMMVESSQDNECTTTFSKLILSAEEKQQCEKDGIILPSHYPLTREEKVILKRVKRKIRNKMSAQGSRKRKRDYMDDVLDKASRSAAENQKLRQRVSLLEAQNKTLMNQLKRMQRLVVAVKNGAGNVGRGTSATALMVVLLSTALFVVPGLREQYGGKAPLRSSNADDVDSSRGEFVVPGKSRSLLQHVRNVQLLDKPSVYRIKDEMEKAYNNSKSTNDDDVQRVSFSTKVREQANI